MRLRNYFLIVLILLLSRMISVQTVRLLRASIEKGRGDFLYGAIVYLMAITQGCASNSQRNDLIKKLKVGMHSVVVFCSDFKTVQKDICLKQVANIIDFEENLNTIEELLIATTGTCYRIDDVSVHTKITTKKNNKAIRARNFKEIISNISSSLSAKNSIHNFFKRFTLSIFIGVDNLCDYADDNPYGSYYETLSLGRTLFARINLNFLIKLNKQL